MHMDGQLILQFHISPSHSPNRILGSRPEYLISKLLDIQKKHIIKRVIVIQLPNSHIFHKFDDLKMMPISRLFKFRLVIFYNRHV